MSYRVLLPDDVVPEAYDLRLEPDLERYAFDGTVVITCNVAVATDVVTVHAKELAVWEAHFKPQGGEKEYEASGIATKVKVQTVAFTFDEPLPIGKGVLTVKFRGTLNDQMAGFYRSQYTRAGGAKATMAVTQFEATDARRCFPCWDEPARKAVFTITLTVPKDLTALSNMPEASVEFVGEKKRVSFLPSPKMSTYLLAFVVGEFEALQQVTPGGTLVRALCVPGRVAQLQYALSCGVRALEFYNEFFGIPFPLPKIDMIAIPDFASGAMENWGLVTYREVDLLCDVTTVSMRQKQRITVTVAHELAHQWFGNLVTMRWWDDLWLNEGFANWMESYCVDHLLPEWRMWEVFVSADQQRALVLDGLRTSHPIQVPIAHAAEVEEVFDSISYSKGGSLVRMLFAVLGQDHFQKGLQLYFKRHAYDNTETMDLAQAWEEVSGKPVKELVGSWTEKMGFPVLKVVKDPFENGGKLELQQQWFLADGSVQPGDDKVQWVVPILLGSDGPDVPQAISFLRAPSQELTVPVAGASWLKLNFGQQVPCRVLYPAGMNQRLSQSLGQLPPEDRIGLLSDSFALCKAGHADPAQVVALLRGFGAEDNDKVWVQLSAVLLALDRLIRVGLPEAVADAFRRFAADFVRPHAQRVGWDHRAEDGENVKQLRQTLIGLLAAFCATEPGVWAEAKPRYAALVGGSLSAVSADIRGAVMAIAAANDPTPATFDELVKLHNAVTDGAVQRDIYGTLARTAPELQKRALEWALSDEVRAQDMVFLPSAVSVSGREGPGLVFEWVKTQFARIYTKVGKTSMMLFSDIVRSSGSAFVQAEKADEVFAFWKEQVVFDQVQKTVNQSCEAVRTNALFVDRLLASPLNDAAYWAA